MSRWLMSTDSNSKKTRFPERQWFLTRFARGFEPFGILIAVCALFASFATLGLEFDPRSIILGDMTEERALREKITTALEEER